MRQPDLGLKFVIVIIATHGPPDRFFLIKRRIHSHYEGGEWYGEDGTKELGRWLQNILLTKLLMVRSLSMIIDYYPWGGNSEGNHLIIRRRMDIVSDNLSAIPSSPGPSQAPDRDGYNTRVFPENYPYG